MKVNDARTIEEFFESLYSDVTNSSYSRLIEKLFFKGLVSLDLGWEHLFSEFLLKGDLNFWCPETLDLCLTELRKSPEATISAILKNHENLSTGYSEIFREDFLKDRSSLKRSSSLGNIGEIYDISSYYHPRYLKNAEHILSSFIAVFWELNRSKKNTNIGLKSRVDILKGKNLHCLVNGYNDDIRNSIAHGNVKFKARDIQYLNKNKPWSISYSEFYEEYDVLRRTIITLALAVLIFIHENKDKPNLQLAPLSVLCLLARRSFGNTGFSYLGNAESEVISGDRVLNIFLELDLKSVESILFTCMKFTYLMLKNGFKSDEDIFYEVLNGDMTPSLVKIRTKIFRELLNDKASFERINEVTYTDGNFIVCTDSKIGQKIKILKKFAPNIGEVLRKSFSDEFVEKMPDKYCKEFWVKNTDNRSVGGVARLHLEIVLDDYNDYLDRDKIKRIINSVVASYKLLPIKTNSSLDEKVYLPKIPSYIWIKVFKFNGPLRWMTSKGWLGHNLVAAAEYTNKEPIAVKNPEEIWEGIRFRYSIDEVEYKQALSSVIETVNAIRADIGNS